MLRTAGRAPPILPAAARLDGIRVERIERASTELLRAEHPGQNGMIEVADQGIAGGAIASSCRDPSP